MALSSSIVWEVRASTGSDGNGGGFNSAASGTDYSRQAAAQVTYSDLVIGATTTQLTSAGNPFTAAHVGNVINVTGGTGFTTGRYEVLSVSGGVATMDRSVGTAASNGGIGALGGALATLATPAAVAIQGHIIWGTGTFAPGGGTLTIPANVTLAGYGSARGDGTNLVFDGVNQNASTNAITMGQPSRLLWVTVQNAKSGGVNSSGTYQAWYCKALNCAGIGFTGANAFACLATGNASSGFGNGGMLDSCYSYGNQFGYSASGATSWVRCIARANTSHGFWAIGALVGGADSCLSVGNTSDGFNIAGGAYVGCVAYGNGAYGYDFTTSRADVHGGLLNCFAGSNTSGAVNNPNATVDLGSPTALSADPFVDRTNANGFGYDFRPNNVAGGGALLRASGWPQSIPGLFGAGYPDAGAFQHQDAGGGSTTYIFQVEA